MGNPLRKIEAMRRDRVRVTTGQSQRSGPWSATSYSLVRRGEAWVETDPPDITVTTAGSVI